MSEEPPAVGDTTPFFRNVLNCARVERAFWHACIHWLLSVSLIRLQSEQLAKTPTTVTSTADGLWPGSEI